MRKLFIFIHVFGHWVALHSRLILHGIEAKFMKNALNVIKVADIVHVDPYAADTDSQNHRD